MQRRATAAQISHRRHGEYRLETLKFQVPEERIIQVKPGDELPGRGAAVKVLVNYDDIARRTGVPVDQPRTCGEAAVSHLFETDAGNILFRATLSTTMATRRSATWAPTFILDPGHE